MIIIASHSIKPINVSIPIPYINPVIVAAMKQQIKEIATKSRLDFE
jgi:hypothetical protein